jgi:uncharacterized membrane protein
MRAITDLLLYRLKHFPDNTIRDEKGVLRIITREVSFNELFAQALYPIWDYGKNDRMVLMELKHLLTQLQSVQKQPVVGNLLMQVQQEIDDKEPREQL